MELLNIYSKQSFQEMNSRKAYYMVRIFQQQVRVIIFCLLMKIGLSNSATAFSYAWILALSQSVNGQLPFIIREIVDDIHNGKFALSLLKPMSIILRYIVNDYVSTILRSVINVFFTLITMFILWQKIPPTKGLIIFLIVYIFSNFACSTLIVLAGLLGFYINDGFPITVIYFKLMLICGALVLPIQAIPGIAKTIIMYSPFAAFYGLPVSLVSFHSAKDISFCISMIIFWMFVVLALMLFIYKKGIRKLELSGV